MKKSPLKKSKSARPIIVAVRTPTRAARALLRKAASLAKLYGAPLRIVHVLAIPQRTLARAGAMIQQAAQADFQNRTAQLEKLAQLPELRGLQVSTSVRCDYPIQDALVREVMERRARMLIAESHRQGSLVRLLLTNIDWELIRNCPCPLWLSKTARFDPKARVLAAVDPLHANGKPARLDNSIVAHAAEIAGADKVSLCHVYELPRGSVADGSLESYWIGISEQDRHAYEEKLGREVSALLQSENIPAQNALMVRGDPVAKLPQLANKHAASVVVMGAVSRRGLERVFIGNTAEQVIDKLGCDVLVIKPRGFKSPLDTQPFRLRTSRAPRSSPRNVTAAGAGRVPMRGR